MADDDVREREVHDDRGVRARLVRSPLVLSFIERARPGDLHDPDATRRSQAWANWAIESMAEVSNGERTYAALRLPGAFYDPRNQAPRIVPHLEVPRRKLGAPDPELPDRLAQCGNGLLFPYWVYAEVTATRRALFNSGPAPVEPLVRLLEDRRDELVRGLESANERVRPHWPAIASLIVSRDDGLAPDATGPFSSDEVAAYLPAAAALGLRVDYDGQLAERAGPWASRRVGVWTVTGRQGPGGEFSLGVVTPRLTVNSLFNDELFAPRREASAAALVRTLQLRRLARLHLDSDDAFRVSDPSPRRDGSHLRAVPVRTGQKLPEASVAAAMRFIEAYPDPGEAWQALESWSERGYVLTVAPAGFAEAHRRAAAALRRMEDPDRADIDCVLPLAWDVREGKSQVVRVTFHGDDGRP